MTHLTLTQWKAGISSRHPCISQSVKSVTFVCDTVFNRLALSLWLEPPTRVFVLNNTKFKLYKSCCYGLCGPNGAGKSTLMRAIANGHLDGFPSPDELKTVFVERAKCTLSSAAQATTENSFLF